MSLDRLPVRSVGSQHLGMSSFMVAIIHFAKAS